MGGKGLVTKQKSEYFGHTTPSTEATAKKHAHACTHDPQRRHLSFHLPHSHALPDIPTHYPPHAFPANISLPSWPWLLPSPNILNISISLTKLSCG